MFNFSEFKWLLLVLHFQDGIEYPILMTEEITEDV